MTFVLLIGLLIQSKNDTFKMKRNKNFCRFLISASRDLSIKIHTLNPIEGYIPFNFIGHKNLCTSFFFNNEMSEVIELF